MSTTAPTTPENTLRKTPLTRSFTLPSKVATTSRTAPSAEIGAAEGIETLYVHPNGKIVKFTTSLPSRPGSSAGTPSPSASGQQVPATLPWATLTEQTLANGPIEIYRVPGSVSFLHSGSLLHAIMPRSNCWCVDGVSKFAIRVLANTYYRIELPGDTPEDLEKVEEFKETLKKVLFYERTACPFARTFTVDLPEEPESPRKKRRKSHGPAKKWRLEKAYSWKPEDGEERQKNESSSDSVTGSDEEGSSSEDGQSNASEAADEVKELKITTPSRPSVRERAKGFNMRSVTAPPQLFLQSTPPSKLRTATTASSNEVDSSGNHGELSRFPEHEAAALDPTSLRPFQPIPTDMPPSPPDSSAGFEHTEHTPRSTLPGQTTVPEIPAASHTADVEHSNSEDGDRPLKDDAAGESAAACAHQWDEKPNAALQSEATNLDSKFTESGRDRDLVTERADAGNTDEDRGAHATQNEAASEACQESNQNPSLPNIEQESGHSKVADAAVDQHSSQSHREEPIVSPKAAAETAPIDPFAQIQARIQARRSIGGTTSFVPSRRSPTRQSSSSTASSGSLSSVRRGQAQQTQQQQQAFATALVRKACNVFLGPPAHLVLIMLRIAARFAKGAFPRSLLYESPAGASKRVPGSFDLEGSDIEDFGLDEEIGDWEEDDFGVPLRSPVRLAAVMNEAPSRTTGSDGSIANSVRGRKGRDVAPEL